MKRNRLGLVMIAATLAVIVLIAVGLLDFQARSHERQIRKQGISLSRSLAGLPYDLLVGSAGRRSVLQMAVGAQRSEGFAYATLVSPQGVSLAEVSMPGTVVPTDVLPTEPAAWFGERELRTPDDGRRILEFHGPVMDHGDLAGFVRLGYLGDAPRPGADQLSFAALLALPVFLLAPLFYGLVRLEMRPLAQLSEKVEQLAHLADMPTGAKAPGLQLEGFIERFGRFLNATEERVRQLEADGLKSVATNRLLAYGKDKVESVLQSLPDGMLVLDESGIATFANSRVEPLLGVAPEQIIGRPLRDWVTNTAMLAFMQRHQLRSGEAAPAAARVEIELGEPSKQHLSLSSYSLFASKDRDRMFGTLVAIRDTTQEHAARSAGTDFVSHVSHELKTPLNTIASYSELLMDSPAPDEALRIEAVNVIHDEVARMASLINNLLSISKIESGAMKIERQRVNLRDLLMDSFESQRKSAIGKGIGFRIEVPPNLGAAALDKDLFRIAINNLLSNAIKYNRPGGFVALSAEDGDDQMLTIQVRDGGIGIPADQRERIFEKYFRVQGDATADCKGHGLGLHLVRQIVELHQGTISVHSQVGQGTEFSIRVRKLAAVYAEAATT